MIFKVPVPHGWVIFFLIFDLAFSASIVGNHDLLSGLECLEDATLLKMKARSIDKVHVYYYSDGNHHLNEAKQTELCLLRAKKSGLLIVTQGHQERDQGLLSCVCLGFWLSLCHGQE